MHMYATDRAVWHFTCTLQGDSALRYSTRELLLSPCWNHRDDSIGGVGWLRRFWFTLHRGSGLGVVHFKSVEGNGLGLVQLNSREGSPRHRHHKLGLLDLDVELLTMFQCGLVVVAVARRTFTVIFAVAWVTVAVDLSRPAASWRISAVSKFTDTVFGFSC